MHTQRNACKILQNNVKQYLHKSISITSATKVYIQDRSKLTISETTKMFFYSVILFFTDNWLLLNNLLSSLLSKTLPFLKYYNLTDNIKIFMLDCVFIVGLYFRIYMSFYTFYMTWRKFLPLFHGSLCVINIVFNHWIDHLRQWTWNILIIPHFAFIGLYILVKEFSTVNVCQRHEFIDTSARLT